MNFWGFSAISFPQIRAYRRGGEALKSASDTLFELVGSVNMLGH